MDECDDFTLVETLYDEEETPCLFLIVADGVGSSRHGREGARGVCTAFAQVLRDELSRSPISSLTRENCAVAALKFLNTVEAKRDYGTTLLAALVMEDETHLYQCGDGDIFYASKDAPNTFQCHVVPVLEEGVFDNNVLAVHSAIAQGEDRFATIPTPQRLALMTDGVSPFFVNAIGEVHEGAAQKLFSSFEAQELTQEQADAKLQATVDQPYFKRRTDDRSAALLFYPVS